MADEFIKKFKKFTNEFVEEGLDTDQAHWLAGMHMNIGQWPVAWGNELRALIYGDLEVPSSITSFPALRIVVEEEKIENSVVRNQKCVLLAKVEVDSKTLEGVLDAVRRINILLGILQLVNWGNCSVGWWSFVTHGTFSGAILGTIDSNELEQAVTQFTALPDSPFRRHLEAALFWIREPTSGMYERKPDLLRVYAGYWNAFECLVQAIHEVRPAASVSNNDKQQALDAFFAGLDHPPTAADIDHCYTTIVNPGFRGRATHALQAVFGTDASGYVDICFSRLPKADRLYQVRNDINHGSIDAENLRELARVMSRRSELFSMLWRMFARIVKLS